jgi:hypothetical protein
MKKLIKRLFGYDIQDDRKVWMYRAVATQANAAGGAIALDITPGAGNFIELIVGHVKNSGTNGINGYVYDSANNTVTNFAYANSGAGTSQNYPSIGSSAGASGNFSNSVGLRVYGTDKFSILQAGAGAQNDTLTIAIRCYCKSAPTISKARSTNAADVTLVETYNTVLEEL